MAAVVRECREETGVTIRDPRAIPFTPHDPSVPLHVFVVDRWDGDVSDAAPDEHDAIGWFDLRQIGSMALADPRDERLLGRLVCA